MTREQAIKFLVEHPYEIGHIVGFEDLKELHNKWIVEMITAKDDRTLQAHRGSYKTTCVSVALAILMILKPKCKIAFIRKTDSDVKEVIKQVQNILASPYIQYFVQVIYERDLILVDASQTSINTNLSLGIKGTPQLTGIGTQSSLTGKHYDIIFTDDIVNLKDRVSRAERERIKLIYQELQNIKNRGGRIYNTGTPWHKEDCFSIMPEAQKWDCYKTKMMSEEEIEETKSTMLPSLFAANYELKHIASENVIFLDPKTGAAQEMIENGIMHLDSAFYGEDYTAWSIMTKRDGKLYLYGKIRRKHVEECYDEVMNDYQKFLCQKLYNESNADKGMVGKELRKLGAKVILYHEDMSKYLKIVTHLKAAWKNIIFVEGTDEEYINQICDYWEDAAHDDAPDSAACLARIYSIKSGEPYKPLWN